MNKFLTVFVIGLFFLCSAEASNTKLIKGSSYDGQIKWKFVKFNLPKGKWIYYANTRGGTTGETDADFGLKS